MKTCLEKLSKANRWRIRTGELASNDASGWNGDFLVPLEGDYWRVRISDGVGWRHLSVANAQRSTLPSWNVMRRLKDYFFADESWVVQFHPAKSENVNEHPWVLHLWEPLNETLPRPPVILV